MKNRFIIIFVLIMVSIFTFEFSFADGAPSVNCYGLPGCVDTVMAEPSPASTTNNLWMVYITKIITQVMQFVAVFAVFSLMISWVYYLISWWEEEKTNKAKTWIIWSLVWVFLSISAWSIIKILNNLIIK